MEAYFQVKPNTRPTIFLSSIPRYWWISNEDQRILITSKQPFSRELETRGLSQSDNPDLHVNIGVVVKEEVQTRETNVREDMRYLGQRNYTWQVQEVPVGTYNEGTVTIDLVDAAKGELVWEGVASAVILKNNKKMQKRIDSGVKKAFKKFSLDQL